MTPSAHIAAVIELLDITLTETHHPADKIVHLYFKTRRFIGSKDRKAIATLFYHVLRYAPRFLNHGTHLFHHARAIVLGTLHWTLSYDLKDLENLFNGQQYAPTSLTQHEIDWLKTPLKYTEHEILCVSPDMLSYLKESLMPADVTAFCEASLKEATVDLRVNTLKTERSQILRDLTVQGIHITETPFSPTGLRLVDRQHIEGLSYFQEGLVEVQDEASQLISLFCDARPGLSVLDYCAGAGGKTLGLAATMKNKGQIIAADIHMWRLDKAKARFRRSGVHNVRCCTLDDVKFFKRHEKYFHRVLIDSPCSGTGTWRRNADLKLRISKADLDNLVQTQKEILEKAAPLVTQGGYLIYATCSVLACENQNQITWFQEKFPEFKIIPVNEMGDTSLRAIGDKLMQQSLTRIGLTMSPHTTQTDGFYICILQRQNACREPLKKNVHPTET